MCGRKSKDEMIQGNRQVYLCLHLSPIVGSGTEQLSLSGCCDKRQSNQENGCEISISACFPPAPGLLSKSLCAALVRERLVRRTGVSMASSSASFRHKLDPMGSVQGVPLPLNFGEFLCSPLHCTFPCSGGSSDH